MSDTPYSSNWQNDLTINGIEVVEKRLQDEGTRRYNSAVKKAYEEALKSVPEAREAINRFIGTYNQEYRKVSSKSLTS